ncbi:PD-(D/E)XK nuclease family protein [Caballeronia sp. M23-90]
MNIFYALSEGRGRLTETNLSAFLAFLLTPQAAHGFGDVFLRTFLAEIAMACGDEKRFQSVLDKRSITAQVGLEVRYEGPTPRTVDIDLQLFDGAAAQTKLHHLIVENKIRAESAQAAQLREQFDCVRQTLREEQQTPITAVFLTPPGEARVMTSEYGSLQLDPESEHKKAWLRWRQNLNEANVSSRTIVDLIRDLLRKEASAEIEPISDYTRHTLKAFVQFLERVIQPTSIARSQSASDADVVLAQKEVDLEGRRYLIVRYASDAIKLFDNETDQELAAHPLLRKINATYGLNVPLERGPGKPINTRQLGRKVLDALGQSAI